MVWGVISSRSPRLVLIVAPNVAVVLLLVVLVLVLFLFVLELAPPWLETQQRNVTGVVNVIWRRVSQDWMKQVPVQSKAGKGATGREKG